ncbi:MAG: hypothetical protein JO229_08070 [Alphaproteobacteria bacterium]|nr:hypothetical protein [Alphaproteobacteria bacterium]
MAVALMATIGLIAYVIVRLLPRARVAATRQPAAIAGTDNPYDNILKKAELLLTYAADNGIEVGDAERRAIYTFRLTDKKDQTADIVDGLYLAYTKLSKAVTPRTAESITETSLERNRGVQKYRKIALILSLFVIPFSVLSFVSSAISTKIGQEIDDGNSLILQLRETLGANFAENKDKFNNSDVIMKTQQLSSTMRALHETGNEIGYTLFGLMPPTPPHPKAIPAGLPDVAQTITDMIPEFQALRQYGQAGRDLVAVIYGAISTCILPVLYALLGVCAKLLGQFEQQIRTRTYVQSEANSAHFVVAAIAGGVVGLFNNFTLGQSASIPPLALAFLIGFSVDVFLSFLETLSQSFLKRSESDPRPQTVVART